MNVSYLKLKPTLSDKTVNWFISQRAKGKLILYGSDKVKELDRLLAQLTIENKSKSAIQDLLLLIAISETPASSIQFKDQLLLIEKKYKR